MLSVSGDNKCLPIEPDPNPKLSRKVCENSILTGVVPTAHASGNGKRGGSGKGTSRRGGGESGGYGSMSGGNSVKRVQYEAIF